MTDDSEFPYPPALKDVPSDDIASKFDAPATALEKLTTYFTARYGRNDAGKCDVADPFMLVLCSAVDAARMLHDSVTILASTEDFSCAHTDSSSMSVTAAEFASNALVHAAAESAVVVATSRDFTSRNLNYVFSHDMSVVVMQARHYVMILTVIAAGKFRSCAHEDVYVGDNKGQGNRLYTPREGAQNMLEQVRELEENAKVVRSVD